MPIGLFQSNTAIAGVANFPGAAVLQLPFTSDCLAGDILLAWVASNSATRPSNVTDTLNNDWEELSQPTQVNPNFSMWGVQNSKPGPNIVSINGMSVSPSGGPAVIIAEFSLIACYKCGTGIQAFNPPRYNSGFQPAFTNLYSWYKVSNGAYFQTIIFGLYDEADAGALTARTWGVTPTLMDQSITLINQIKEDGGNNTSVLAMSTLPYPYIYNECQLIWTPTTPPLYGDETNPFGCLINTLN
jgi:hypothetical protein